MKTQRNYALIFKGNKTSKKYGYETASAAKQDYPESDRVEFYRNGVMVSSI